MSHPERIVPDDTEPGIVALHVKRYEFARPSCTSREILDAGCGAGYGTALLGEVAKRAVGVDIDADAIAYARERYGGERVQFEVQDLTELAFPDESFDVVVSFETIEHLDEPERFLEQVRRVLRPTGRFFVSTPRVDATTRTPTNPFHRVELSRADFESLLTRFFADVDVFGQHRVQTLRHRAAQRLDVFGLRKRFRPPLSASKLLGTTPMAEVTSGEIAIDKTALDRSTELVAVCTR